MSNVDLDLYRHKASLSHNELKGVSLSEIAYASLPLKGSKRHVEGF